MMTDRRSLLALGAFAKDQRLLLAAAAEQSAFTPEFMESGREAARWLDAHSPDAVVLDDDPAARNLCLEARAQVKHARIPMLSLAREVDDLAFAEVFSWGGDDAVTLRDSHSLTARLRGLPTTPPGAPGGESGLALIVDADRSRRIVLGHVLRNAGYGIEFAVSEDDARARVRERAPRLVVASADVSAAPAGLVAGARSAGSSATWIFLCPPRELSAHRAAMEPLGNVAVTDAFAPAENVVFLANELERGGANDKRSSRRLLYGATVSFRGAGRDTDEYGFSYNLSLGGLYVRTLAPPEDDLVWLEVRPPRSERRVRLEGRVVWRRKFGPSQGATVPPGFGVALTDGTRRDMDAWENGYGAFSEALGLAVEPRPGGEAARAAAPPLPPPRG